MTAELDHIFICCAEGAPEADWLIQSGFVEGSANTHPGQGTANRRFFFSNTYLELLWVCDPAEAQSEPVVPTQLWERWQRRSTGACPFGIVFRPKGSPFGEAPFPSWSYRPAYLPAGLAIEVGLGLALSEPQLFYLPFARPPGARQPQPISHPTGIEAITGVTVTLPDGGEPSETLRLARDCGLLRIARGPSNLLDLTVTGNGQSVDLRPVLPLTLSRVE
jgi:hypothetical protein